jgi:intracellular multiplication protein IcmJ
MSLKLQFQAKANNWERFKLRKANPKFKKICAAVFQRDQFTCQYTGYRGPGLEVVNKDGDYGNNTSANLVTACSLSARCLLMDAYPLSYDGPDKIIYLPEMSQAQLLNLCRVLFCQAAESGEDGSETTYNAKMIIAQLQDRANWMDEHLGVPLSNPGAFAYYINQQERDINLINRLRWLPAPESFQEAISGWRKALGMAVENSHLPE